MILINSFLFYQEKPDPNAKPAIDFDNKIAAERERQMKVIVPNSTAGMIIGKGGSFIKHLKVKFSLKLTGQGCLCLKVAQQKKV